MLRLSAFFLAAVLAATAAASPLPQDAPAAAVQAVAAAAQAVATTAQAAAAPAQPQVIMEIMPMSPEESAEAAALEGSADVDESGSVDESADADIDEAFSVTDADADATSSDTVSLVRRQFGPQVTQQNMHWSTQQQMVDVMARPTPGALPFHPHLPALPLSQNSFYQNEVFALYNPHKRTCLAVRPDNKEPKLITQRCQLDQAHTLNSQFAFHWLPAQDNNLAYLAIIYQGRRLCAKRRWKGTYFYPCNEHSIKYSLGATTKRGLMHVRDAAHGSQCMDAYRHSGLHMNRCRMGSRDQGWSKMHIAFLNGPHVLPRRI